MTLMRDVYPVPFDLAAVGWSHHLLRAVVLHLVEIGVFSKEDVFLLTHGEDILVQGKTSTLKVYRVAEVLAKDAALKLESIATNNDI